MTKKFSRFELKEPLVGKPNEILTLVTSAETGEVIDVFVDDEESVRREWCDKLINLGLKIKDGASISEIKKEKIVAPDEEGWTDTYNIPLSGLFSELEKFSEYQ